MKKKKHVFFSLVCRCCCYCYKLSVQKSFFFFISNLSLDHSLSLCLSVIAKNVRTTASIYLFVCREYFMSIPCIWLWLVLNRKCRICHMIWNRFEYSSCFFFSFHFGIIVHFFCVFSWLVGKWQTIHARRPQLD